MSFFSHFNGIALSFSSWNLMMSIGLLYITFIMLKYYLLSLIFPRFFSWIDMQIYKFFSIFNEMNMCFFLSVYWYGRLHFIFYMLNYPLIFFNVTNLIMLNDFWCVLGFIVLCIFLQICSWWKSVHNYFSFEFLCGLVIRVTIAS